MRVYVTEETTGGESMNYGELYNQVYLDVLMACGRILDGEEVVPKWEGPSLGGKEGCAVFVDEDAVIVVEGTEGQVGNAWLIVTSDDGKIVRLVIHEKTGQRIPEELPEVPQEALGDVKRILDVLNGMDLDRGTLQNPFS